MSLISIKHLNSFYVVGVGGRGGDALVGVFPAQIGDKKWLNLIQRYF